MVSRLTAIQQIVRSHEDDIAAFRIVADHAQRQHTDTVAREYRERQEELYHDALNVCDDLCELAAEVDAAFLEFNAKLAELNARVGDVFEIMRARDKDRETPLFRGMWSMDLAWKIERDILGTYRSGGVVREFNYVKGHTESFRNSVKAAR